MPEDTLEDGAGDCEDMAALLASMLLSYNDGEYAIWMLVIRSEKLGLGHIAVAFPVQDGRLTILDPAGNYYTGQYGPVNSSNVSNAINNWLSHWQKAMPDAEITTVFSEDIFEEFSSTAEFITWAQEQILYKVECKSIYMFYQVRYIDKSIGDYVLASQDQMPG